MSNVILIVMLVVVGGAVFWLELKAVKKINGKKGDK